MIEDQDRLEEAFQQYVELAIRFPANETGQVGVVRLLRKLGDLNGARAALQSLASRPEASSAVAVEMAQIEIESANYEEAEQWFGRADLDRTENRDVLRAAATAFALEEEVTRADRLFARADADYRRVRRIDDLRARLKTDPGDKNADGELERLSLQSRIGRADTGVPQRERAAEDRRPSRAASASDLYALHCSACHGDDGRGDGRAARHLFPRPRDLRTDKSRLPSTINGVPTLEDLEAVI
jgi:tetratricopeptide (TPR) repeat protein